MKNFQSVSATARSLRKTAPTVNVAAFSSVSSGVARIMVDVTHTSESRANPEAIFSAINEKFGNKLQAVASSFKTLDKGPLTQRIVGLVQKTTEAVVFEPGMDGFRAMSSNIFMDKEESMWTLRQSESGKLLVKSTGIEDDADMLNLLSAQCSAVGTTGFGNLVAACSVAVQGGDLISFISNSGDLKIGYVIASTDTAEIPVIPLVGDVEQVPEQAIVEKLADGEVEAPELTEAEKIDQAVAAARGVVDIEAIVGYYKRVYGHNATFFAQLEQRIRSHKFA